MDKTTAGGASAQSGPSSVQGGRTAEPDAGRAKIAVAVGGLLALSAVGASAAFVAEEMAPVAEPPVASVALAPAGGGASQTPAEPGGPATPAESASAGLVWSASSLPQVRVGAVPVQNVAPASSPPTGVRLGSIAVPVPVRVLNLPPPVAPAPAQPAPVGAANRPGGALTPSLFAAGLVEASKSPVPARSEVPMAVVARARGSAPTTASSAIPPGPGGPVHEVAPGHVLAVQAASVAGAVTANKAAAATSAAGVTNAEPVVAVRAPATHTGAVTEAAADPGARDDRSAPGRTGGVVGTGGANQAVAPAGADTRPGPAGPAQGRDHGDGPSH